MQIKAFLMLGFILPQMELISLVMKITVTCLVRVYCTN